jgi:hypothetical protein
MLYEKIQFEAGEQVLKTVRKHWFIIVTELFGVATMIALPFFIAIFILLFPELVSTFDWLESYAELLIFITTLWLLLSLLTGFMLWTHYYLDLWVITDRRIIVIDQIHFFNRKVSSFRLERLQDIKVTINGILATFLNFGTLRAQTASAAESNFQTAGLPDPKNLQALIQHAMDERLKTIHGQTQHKLDM